MTNNIVSGMALEFDSGIPIYKQVFNQLVAIIANGVLNEGDKLPSIRELSSALEVNPNTVARSFLELEMQGYIKSQRGNGTFVSARQNIAELSEAEKADCLDKLFNKFMAEANCLGISRGEVFKYIESKYRLKENS